uniref:Coiled-coil domain-containing protein 130 n=1 Tax=Tetraselmis sp. GSL018 TaxID=582737 RepID=A0A061R9W8_9CHLO|eukprot:CAMPEP_0177587510 /NCGR_PEP_ID=MMETSP0419_2-20121207/5697_1 /TAXON_ID=582737 /ORGANISM="Tetraselmis sp., Strain GSL018" /LENGTH=276 /DNA_ID=CAMNT_0019077579 /DNA_START=177 /DNA_END=1007 /DNA_ORIENTATION=+
MSSLAAARADNFYYPPDWNPNTGTGETSKLGSKKAKNGSLGHRANKTSQGVLTIRFEMPFNVWCDGCNHLIAKGVRFNAEKRQHGSYFSTKIWSFVMRSPCCSTEIEVRTDPKSCDYIVVRGARRKVEEYEAEDAGTAVLTVGEGGDSAAANPFARLENGEIDRAKAMGERERLTAMRMDSDRKQRDDYVANKALRRRLRGVRKEAKALDSHRQRLGLHSSVKLLPHNAEDDLLASATQFDTDWRFRRNAEHSRWGLGSQEALRGGAAAGRKDEGI